MGDQSFAEPVAQIGELVALADLVELVLDRLGLTQLGRAGEPGHGVQRWHHVATLDPADPRGPWLAIDPKGFNGDPCFEPAPLLWNRWDALVATGDVGGALRERFYGIVDAAGQVVPPGSMGEICLRGVTVMEGYWNDPEATANAMRGGWFHTGDVG